MSLEKLPYDLLWPLFDQLAPRTLNQLSRVSHSLRECCQAYQEFWQVRFGHLLDLEVKNPRGWYRRLSRYSPIETAIVGSPAVFLPILLLALRDCEWKLTQYLVNQLRGSYSFAEMSQDWTQLEIREEMCQVIEKLIEEEIMEAIRKSRPLRDLIPYAKYRWDEGRPEAQDVRNWYLGFLTYAGSRNLRGKFVLVRHLLEIEVIDPEEGYNLPISINRPHDPVAHEIVLEAALLIGSNEFLKCCRQSGLTLPCGEVFDRILQEVSQFTDQASLAAILKFLTEVYHPFPEELNQVIKEGNASHKV